MGVLGAVRCSRRFAQDEAGTSSVEYALLAAITAITITLAWPSLRPGLERVFGAVGDATSQQVEQLDGGPSSTIP